MLIKVGDICGGELRINSSGSAYLVSDELENDIYINKKNLNRVLHLDTVEVEIIDSKKRDFEGKVIEIVDRFKTKFVGTLEVSDKFAFLIADSNKMKTDIFIPIKKLLGGKDGQKVVAQLTNWKEGAKNPNGKVIEVLGECGDNDVEIHSILHEYGLPYSFEEEVEDEANRIKLRIPKSEIKKRKDMRDILTFTIDPDTAKDFDDALSFETIGDNIRVGIHIADVSHYVTPDTPLDKEAYNRGTSIYLVDRVVPMLPERLSNGVCSLRPLEDKLCFSAVFTLDSNGKILEEWFGRTITHCNHRFTYEEAQLIIEGEDYSEVFESLPKDYNSQIVNAIKDLDTLAKKMRAKRFKNGSISFDSREVKFKLDEENKPVGISFKTSKDSNKLIEEYMLLANRRVAQFLNKKKVAIPNRVHAEPDENKLNELKEYVKQFDYELKINNSEDITYGLNQLLLDVKGSPEENIVSNLVIRTMQKAEYSPDNIGHYGLGFIDYAHFTSPIRRYPDIILHRTLDRVLNNKDTMKQNKLEPKCKHLSNREIKAQKASRDSIKFKQCEYMLDKVGKIYKAVINSVTNYGVFVEMPENNCEGLVRLSEIGEDTFTSDLKNHCVIGYNTGIKYRVGDKVSVIVKNVSIDSRNIDLSIIRL